MIDRMIKELDRRVDELEAVAAGYARRDTGHIVPYALMQSQAFTTTQDGVAGAVMQFLVSPNGPFIMTHYPVVSWKPTAPSDAVLLNRWRPISSWDLPDQFTSLDAAIIDISWTMEDAGSGRKFQSAGRGRRQIDGLSQPTDPTANLTDRVPAGLLAWPEDVQELPVHVYFRQGTTILFTPFYENILFDTETTHEPTDGLLVVALPGYRIL